MNWTVSPEPFLTHFSAINSSLGIFPASESLLAFTIIMNRIVISPE